MDWIVAGRWGEGSLLIVDFSAAHTVLQSQLMAGTDSEGRWVCFHSVSLYDSNLDANGLK